MVMKYLLINKHMWMDLKRLQLTKKEKKQLDHPLLEEEKKQLRSVCGQLLWAMSQARHDGAFHSCHVSNYGDMLTVRSLIEASRVIRKLKNDKLKVNFPFLGDPKTMKVVVYGDGSDGSLPSSASQGANTVFLPGNGRSTPVTWQSKKLVRVRKSPLASEVMSVADADAEDSGFMVASIIKELYDMRKVSVIGLRTGSKSLKEHLGMKKVIQDPHLRVDTARLREMVEIGAVHARWVPTELMLGDCLTEKMHHPTYFDKSWRCLRTCEDNNKAKNVNNVNSVKKKRF